MVMTMVALMAWPHLVGVGPCLSVSGPSAARSHATGQWRMHERQAERASISRSCNQPCTHLKDDCSSNPRTATPPPRRRSTRPRRRPAAAEKTRVSFHSGDGGRYMLRRTGTATYCAIPAVPCVCALPTLPHTRSLALPRRLQFAHSFNSSDPPLPSPTSSSSSSSSDSSARSPLSLSSSSTSDPCFAARARHLSLSPL